MMLNRSSHAAKNRNNFSKMMTQMGYKYNNFSSARNLSHESLDTVVFSATARAAAPLRLRTLATSVFVRSVATRSGTKPSVRPAEREFDEEVTQLIDKEVKESSSIIDPVEQYLKDYNYQLSEVQGVVTLKRHQGKHIIEASFSVVEEEEEGDEDGEYDEEDEEDEEDAEEVVIQEMNQDTPVLSVHTAIKITVVDKMDKELGNLSLSCSAQDGRLFIDTMNSADGQHEAAVAEFSDELQMKLYEFLEHLKVDNKLGTFVSEYYRNHHTHVNVKILNDLRKFVTLLKDD